MVGQDHEPPATRTATAGWRPQEADELTVAPAGLVPRAAPVPGSFGPAGQPVGTTTTSFGREASSFASAPRFGDVPSAYGASRFGGLPAATSFGSPQFGSSQLGSAQFGAAPVGAPTFGTAPFGAAAAPAAAVVWETPKTDGVAVAGFVLSLLLWPVGLVMSVVALGRTGSGRRRGRGLAVAGVAVSAVSAVVTVLALAVALPVFSAQQQAAQASQVRTALTSTSVWVQTVAAGTGAYPATLDASAPRTDPVVVDLVPDPAGGPPCLQAALGQEVLHAVANGGPSQAGTCS